MFDIGWQELFIVAVLAIIVIGPKDLPRAMRTVGSVVRKARSMANEFRSSLEDMAREAELDEARKEIDAISGTDIRRQIEDTVDPTGDFADDLDMSDIESDLDTSIRDSMAPPDSIAAGAPERDAEAAPAPATAEVETVPETEAPEPPAAEEAAEDAEAAAEEVEPAASKASG